MSPDGRPAFLPPLLDAFKAKPGQIKLIDKDIDRPVLSITIPPKQNAP